MPWEDIIQDAKWYTDDSLEAPEYLGFPLSHNKALVHKFLEGRLLKIKNKLQFLGQRSLSLAGKVMVINTFLTSQLWHVLRIIKPSQKFLQLLKSSFIDFLWGNKIKQVSWDMLSCM